MATQTSRKIENTKYPNPGQSWELWEELAKHRLLQNDEATTGQANDLLCGTKRSMCMGRAGGYWSPVESHLTSRSDRKQVRMVRNRWSIQPRYLDKQTKWIQRNHTHKNEDWKMTELKEWTQGIFLPFFSFLLSFFLSCFLACLLACFPSYPHLLPSYQSTPSLSKRDGQISTPRHPTK